MILPAYSPLVRQQYDQLSQIYDQRWRTYLQHTLGFLHDWAQFSPHERVLDIACGTGTFSAMILARHPQQPICGIDISQQMLEIAAAKCSQPTHAHFQQACVAALPFAAASFDVALCANSFHYFDHPVASLLEIKRVLSPGARLIILDWCKDFLVCRCCDAILPWFDPAYKQCYTVQQLQGFLTQAGLTTRRAQHVQFGVTWGLMAVEAEVSDQ